MILFTRRVLRMGKKACKLAGTKPYEFGLKFNNFRDPTALDEAVLVVACMILVDILMWKISALHTRCKDMCAVRQNAVKWRSHSG